MSALSSFYILSFQRKRSRRPPGSFSIFVSPIGDGRRAMDKELGWFHACSAYPLSDLKIKIPIM